jgi:hypothetical protein
LRPDNLGEAGNFAGKGYGFFISIVAAPLEIEFDDRAVAFQVLAGFQDDGVGFHDPLVPPDLSADIEGGNGDARFLVQYEPFGQVAGLCRAKAVVAEFLEHLDLLFRLAEADTVFEGEEFRLEFLGTDGRQCNEKGQEESS